MVRSVDFLIFKPSSSKSLNFLKAYSVNARKAQVVADEEAEAETDDTAELEVDETSELEVDETAELEVDENTRPKKKARKSTIKTGNSIENSEVIETKEKKLEVPDMDQNPDEQVVVETGDGFAVDFDDEEDQTDEDTEVDEETVDSDVNQTGKLKEFIADKLLKGVGKAKTIIEKSRIQIDELAKEAKGIFGDGLDAVRQIVDGDGEERKK